MKNISNFTTRAFALVLFAAPLGSAMAAVTLPLVQFSSAAGGVSYLQLSECKLSSSRGWNLGTNKGLARHIPKSGSFSSADFNYRCAPGAGPFEEAIDEFMNGQRSHHSMSVLFLDNPTTKMCSRYTFTDALITSFTTPVLDRGATSAACYQVCYTVNNGVTWSSQKQPAKVQIPDLRTYTGGRFQLDIAGMDNACARVSKIDSFTIKQGIADVDGDGFLDLEMSDFTMEIPVDTVSEANLWLMLGDSRACTLSYLDNNGIVMRKLSFTGLCPISVAQRSTSTCTVTCGVTGDAHWTS